MKDPIAIDKVFVQLPNEPLREVTIQVGRPFKDPEYPDEWLCPASLASSLELTACTFQLGFSITVSG